MIIISESDMFKKKTPDYRGKAIMLYEPEDLSNIEDRFSLWRKSESLYHTDKTTLFKYNELLKRLINYTNTLSALLATALLLGVLYLVLFGNFEKTVLIDGTYLSCVVQPDGTIGVDF